MESDHVRLQTVHFLIPAFYFYLETTVCFERCAASSDKRGTCAGNRQWYFYTLFLHLSVCLKFNNQNKQEEQT